MDDGGGPRENGRQRQDHYKLIAQHQWMQPQHSQSMKDHAAIKLMAVMANRDTLIQERDAALNEKKAALAERDMAILHRETAYAERNAAWAERDAALEALECARENGMICQLNSHGGPSRVGGKHSHVENTYHHREALNPEAYALIPTSDALNVKPRRMKRPPKEGNNILAVPKAPRPRKPRRQSTGEDLNKQLVVSKQEWKHQDLGLNQVTFDDSTMPIPVCSCTGMSQQCYKWGNGGWQSACCTTTLSMYPLPIMPNKRNTRVGGRKMSGNVFNKLLSKLAAEGHDLSVPIDLKDHWAKHGTNRYITISKWFRHPDLQQL